MTEVKKNIFPLTEVDSPRIDLAIPLPAHLGDNIGMNVGRLHRLMRIGGIKHLSIVGRSGEETSGSVPMVVGINSQGGAYAGKAEVKTVITHAESLDHNSTRLIPHGALWANGEIVLNMSEIDLRIAREEKWRDTSPKEAWSYHLDLAVREGVANLGWEHLTSVNLTQVKRERKTLMIALGLAIATNILTNVHPFISVPDNSMAKILGDVIFDLGEIYLFMRGKDAFDSVPFRGLAYGPRFSLFWGGQYDRAFLLTGLTKFQRIIQSIN